MTPTRILCVDDDVPQLTIISMVLKKEGYLVETARDGNEGLKKARDWKPDLIIMDVMMPGLDGFQATKTLKADPDTAHIGVLMLTAKGGVDENVKEAYKLATRVQDRLKGFDSGAVDFLTKPVKAKDLVQRVKAVLWATGTGFVPHED
ncbi:MAG: response regulator [Chloroflexi bacterium]|nr:response regulator [Chloroflexota bacterium]